MARFGIGYAVARRESDSARGIKKDAGLFLIPEPNKKNGRVCFRAGIRPESV